MLQIKNLSETMPERMNQPRSPLLASGQSLTQKH